MHWRRSILYVAVGLAVCMCGTAWAEPQHQTGGTDDATVDVINGCDGLTDTFMVYSGTTVSYTYNDAWIKDGNQGIADRDCYMFDIQTVPCVVVADCTRDVEDPAPPDTLDPYLKLFDVAGPAGAPAVAEADDEGTGARNQDSRLVYCVQTAGIYTLGVSSLWGTGTTPPGYFLNDCPGGSPNYSPTAVPFQTNGGYDLTITIYQPNEPPTGPCGEDGIPLSNDTILGATPVTLGVPQTCNIGDGRWGNSSGDYDWFSFNVTDACSIIRVSVRTQSIASDLKAVLNIWDGTCTLMAQCLKFDPFPADGEQVCTGDLVCELYVTTVGMYFAEVHGSGSGTQSDCTVDCSGGGVGSTGDYEITVTVQGTAPVTDEEDNDSLPQATATGLNTSGLALCANKQYSKLNAYIGNGICGCVVGVPDEGGDYDFYEVVVGEDCELLICVDTVEKTDNLSALDAFVGVWEVIPEDPFFNFIDGTIGDTGICAGPCMWFSPENAGDTTYYIGVHGRSGNPNDPTVPVNNVADCSDGIDGKIGPRGIGYYDLYVMADAPYLSQNENLECYSPADNCEAWLLAVQDFFNDINNAYDTEMADEFVIPEGETWDIFSLHASFSQWNTPDDTRYWLDTPYTLRVRIMDNLVGGGCEGEDIPDVNNVIFQDTVVGFVDNGVIWSAGTVNYLGRNPDTTMKRLSGDMYFDICVDRIRPDPLLSLGEGKYWLYFQPRVSFGNVGQTGWAVSNNSRFDLPCGSWPNGQPAEWQNLGGGFGFPCPTWNSTRMALDGDDPACDAPPEGTGPQYWEFDMSLKVSQIPYPCCPCKADLNNVAGDPCDDNVDFVDFTNFSNAWLKGIGDPGYDPCADFDGSGSVDFTDFTVFSNLWLGACQPW